MKTQRNKKAKTLLLKFKKMEEKTLNKIGLVYEKVCLDEVSN